MPKITIEATELTETKVDFVSLVKRGANRIPFRVTKGDKEMLDLSKLGRNWLKKEETTEEPVIAAALVKSGSDMTALAQIFKSADMEPKTFVQKQDKDAIHLVKSGVTLDETSTTIGSEHLALVVTGLQKGFVGLAGDSAFAERMKAASIYPSLCSATEMLEMAMFDAIYSAESPKDAASKLAKAVDEFKQYAIAMAKELPTQAFKLDVELHKAAFGKGPGFNEASGNNVSADATADDKKTMDATASESTTGDLEDRKVKKAAVGGRAEEEAPGAAHTETIGSDEKDPKSKKKDDEGSEADLQKQAIAGLPDPKGHMVGDGDGFAEEPTDTNRAVAAGSADDKKMHQNGTTTGSSIPDGNPGLTVKKNEGDEAIGQTGTGQTLPEDQSGSGAQQPKTTMPTATDLTKMDEILGAIASLQKSFSEQVDAIKQEVASVTDRVDQVAVMAKKTDAALNGTVFNVEGEDRVSTKKSDAETYPLLDTAYNRRTA